MNRASVLLLTISIPLAICAPAAVPAWVTTPVPDSAAAPEPPGPPKPRRLGFTLSVAWPAIPKSIKKLDLWVPVPYDDANQEVRQAIVRAPSAGLLGKETEHGNRMYYFSSGPRGGVAYNISIRSLLERRPVFMDLDGPKPPVPPQKPWNLDRYLKGEELAPIDGDVRKIASRIVKGKKDDLAKARAIYDHVVSKMKLSKKGEVWGHGMLKSTLESMQGNTFDISTAFVGLARAAGIPARSVFGFKVPPAASEGHLLEYHTWAEFWLPEWGWVPVEPSEAIRRPGSKEEHFGRLDEHRIQISVGRDVTLTPPQDGEKLNFSLYPYAEADGKPLRGSAYQFSYDAASDFPNPPSPSGR